jgi:uncharacterized coiled-coil protein SlyX
MWILQWLPDWIFYAILALGIIGFILTYLLKFIPIPAIYMYKTPIQIVSLLLIVIGVYMSGAISNEQAWQARVKELEVKLAAAEAEGAKETIKIVEKVVTQQKVIKEKGEEIVKYIDREVVKYDTKFLPGGECEIPKEFIKSLNEAAKAPEGGVWGTKEKK